MAYRSVFDLKSPHVRDHKKHIVPYTLLYIEEAPHQSPFNYPKMLSTFFQIYLELLLF